MRSTPIKCPVCGSYMKLGHVDTSVSAVFYFCLRREVHPSHKYVEVVRRFNEE